MRLSLQYHHHREEWWLLVSGDAVAIIRDKKGEQTIPLKKGEVFRGHKKQVHRLASKNGGVVVEADATEIVDRILGVLAQGAASLSRMDDVAAASSGAGPRPRRFEFVHNAELRPVLERAFADSRDALERGEFGLALILSCGVIEAVLTDALDHAAPRAHDAPSLPAVASAEAGGRIADWSFEARIAAAEHAGLIRGGCARLPPVARTYRNLTDADGELRADAPVSEREARLAGQVLHVVMRDLDPGR